MFAEVVSDRGQGPPLVYLPGIDGSGQMLYGTAARLEQRFRLIRLRYRLSANPEHRSYAHLASSAIETVSLRGVDRPLLLAESFGGAVALRAALDFPDAVSALALVNTFAHYRRRILLSLSHVGTRMTPDWMMAAGRRLLGPALLFGGSGERRVIEEFMGDDRRSPGSSRMTGSRRSTAAFALDQGYPARLRMIQGLDLRGELGKVAHPVALFASRRDRIVDAVRQATEMAGLLPDAELEVLEGRGHVVLPIDEIDWPAHLERLNGRVGSRRR